MKIKKVTTEREKNEYLKMEYEVSIHFIKYAKKVSIKDSKIENYTLEDSKKYLAPEYIKYVFYEDEIIVGMAALKYKVSDYDNQKVLELVDLYIKKEYRNMNYGKIFIDYLLNNYKCRIEASCYYNAPANKFYKKLGFNQLETVYSIQSSKKTNFNKLNKR